MKRTLPHGLPFAPVKVGVLIDIDMGTIRMAGKRRASAQSDTAASLPGHARVMRQPHFMPSDTRVARARLRP